RYYRESRVKARSNTGFHFHSRHIVHVMASTHAFVIFIILIVATEAIKNVKIDFNKDVNAEALQQMQKLLSEGGIEKLITEAVMNSLAGATADYMKTGEHADLFKAEMEKSKMAEKSENLQSAFIEDNNERVVIGRDVDEL
ncbi:hypothetical protein PENTCL1PPCAC_8150, partial [Pristionchus entomophagus]